MLDKIFNFKEHKTDFKTEVIAGGSTFLTMAYIMFLNPAILSIGGFEFNGVFTATILAIALACFIAAFYARTWPIVLAPGLGISAFIAITVCSGMGYTSAEALGAMLVSGVLFLIISLSPIRAWLINSIPKSLKLGIRAGIALFLGLIGFKLIGSNQPMILLGAGAFISMIVLEKMKVKGNTIIGIITFSAIAWLLEIGDFTGVISSPPQMTYLLAFDFGAIFTAGMLTAIFTLVFISFFETAGTLTSIANVSGKVGSDGKIKDLDKAMFTTSASSITSSILGTSTVTTYVESGAGVKAGGRTGMTSLVIGVLFLFCIFLAPLASSIPIELIGATLFYLATLLIRDIVDIEWADIPESAPALIAMLSTPITNSVSNGIFLGFISYVLIKVFTGKVSNTSPATWIIAILGLITFLW